MRVLVNAVSIREGGPRVVLVKLLPALVARSDAEFVVAAPPETCAELRHTVHKLLPFDIGRSAFGVVEWYERGLAAAVRACSADVVFSLTNYLPLRRLPTPTLLLVQHAGHFSSEFERSMRGTKAPWTERVAWLAKRSWVRRSVKRADVLTVQTQALADAIVSRTHVRREQIRVVPHGAGWVERREPLPPRQRSSGAWRIGYVSKFGIQKNFEVLLRAAKTLADEGMDFRVVLTLDCNDAAGRKVLARADALGLSARLENHGEVAPQKLTGLYDSLDVFVFPSLCESFGMPMLEAMARGLCIVVADTPENREMTGPAGLRFPPHDHARLAAILRRLHGNEAERLAFGRLGSSRANQFSWTAAADGTLQALREAASAHAA